MPSINNTRTTQFRTITYSFRDFQDLPPLVLEALVWGVKQRQQGECSESDMTAYIIAHYDMNQTLSIGALTLRLSRFLDDFVRVRMVWCYVEHNCNMLAAKLAWREDY